MHLENITIYNSNVNISGLTYSPDHPLDSLPCVVLSHGLTASKESVDLAAGYLCGRGYPCVTFDFRGHKLGGTGGRLNSITQAEEDLDTVVSWALKRFGKDRCVIVGHSMGGFLAAAVGARRQEVSAVALIACGITPSRGFLSVVGQAMTRQRADYVDGAAPVVLLEELDAYVGCVSQLGTKPMLFIAAKGDVLVKPTKARALADMAGAHAEYVEIDGSHLEASMRSRGTVANWLDRLYKRA